MRVIVIDDEMTILTVAERILSKRGHEVLIAPSGEAGIEILTELTDTIDLILLDWAMPGMSGLETFEKIRELAPEMPIVFSSGYEIDTSSEGLSKGPHIGFLEKPYRARTLLAKIQKMVPAGG